MRLYVALAIATNIPVSEWLKEPDEVIATALDILEKQAKEARKG